VSDDWASLKRVDRFSAGLSLRDILLILVVRGVEKTRDAKKGQADRSESRFFAGWDGMGWDAAIQYWKSVSVAEALRELLTGGAEMAALTLRWEGHYCKHL
jgi:hypothetical protein